MEPVTTTRRGWKYSSMGHYNTALAGTSSRGFEPLRGLVWLCPASGVRIAENRYHHEESAPHIDTTWQNVENVLGPLAGAIPQVGG